MSVKQLESYTEEVYDILGHIPHWIIRWGITVLLIIFLCLIVVSYYFKYPYIVSVPFVLTTYNPPSPIISNINGRISKWYVSNGESVSKGQVIAVLDNSSNYKDIIILIDFIDKNKGNWIKKNDLIELPQNLSLGTIQNSFLNFQRAYENLQNNLQNNLLDSKIEVIEDKLINQKQQYELLKKQKILKSKEYDVAREVFISDSIAYYNGGFGIIKSEYENYSQEILNKQASLLSIDISLLDVKTTYLQLKESLIELKIRKENDLNLHENELNKAFFAIKIELDDWKKKYLLLSPINGKITLTEYWSENQVINSGERLATIVPHKEKSIVARAYIPSSALGRIGKNQKVNIKLSGFPYMEYGVLIGKINSISMVPEEKGYIAEIKLSKGMISSYSERLKFIQQMDGTADIITEDTRLIYRLLLPLRKLLL